MMEKYVSVLSLLKFEYLVIFLMISPFVHELFISVLCIF